MDYENKNYGKLEVVVPDDSFEAGQISTARIIIKNPFELPVEILEIDSPRSSTLKDIGNECDIKDALADSSLEKSKKEQSYEVSASIGKSGGLWASILNAFGLSAEVKFGEVRSAREKILNIKAEKNSEITIQHELSQYEIINIKSEESAKVNLKEPEKHDSHIQTIAVISPHCELIQYFPFKTTGWLFFKPMRINASVQIKYKIKDIVKTQVVPAALDVRPPIASMVLGALIGAILGTIARIFVQKPTFSWKDTSVAIGASTVMSLIATIALMRKSGSQGFITVEDFFGSFVLGTLIGYSGSDYFEKAIIPESK